MRGVLINAMALLSWSCWAPEVVELSDEPVGDPGLPSPNDPEAQGTTGRATPQVSLEGTVASQFPEPPFTAWTVHSPMSIQAPGQDAEPMTLRKRGIRIEVLQVLDAPHNRMRIRCDGCSETGAQTEGWLQTDKLIRVKGSHGSSADPLASILRQRARWASDQGIPQGSSRNDLCTLVDHGFSLEGNAAIWSYGGGRIEMRFEEGEWQLQSLIPPENGQTGNCRTSN